MGVTTIYTPGRRQSKTPILSRNVDKKSIETVFSIAICRHTGDKWESKTLFLSIFDPRSSIVDNVFDRRLPGVIYSKTHLPTHLNRNMGLFYPIQNVCGKTILMCLIPILVGVIHFCI